MFKRIWLRIKLWWAIRKATKELKKEVINSVVGEDKTGNGLTGLDSILGEE